MRCHSAKRNLYIRRIIVRYYKPMPFVYCTIRGNKLRSIPRRAFARDFNVIPPASPPQTTAGFSVTTNPPLACPTCPNYDPAPTCVVFTSFIIHGTGNALSDDNGRTLVTTAPPKPVSSPTVTRRAKRGAWPLRGTRRAKRRTDARNLFLG
jgi:hypothetical protein